ncbi:PIH1 domain-containing protein 2 isoform X2 [Meleagris gallopavo]|uniref:PIH1 domain-containing protein 2 isoform X2 n=1 Tax=Meleagris gallopavo TaxID=9103 RepID=UPI00093A9D18|nr:PIH1 domain-containing protein 2 isoform X2 [Meleagris gallopavo]
MEHLIHLTLKFIEELCNLILSHSYKIEPFKLKGSPERMWQRLKGRQLPPPHLGRNTEKELMLDQLLHIVEDEDCSNTPVLLKEENVTQSKVQLIEEISSTEVPEELSTPAYEMITVRDANNKPQPAEASCTVLQVLRVLLFAYRQPLLTFAGILCSYVTDYA